MIIRDRAFNTEMIKNDPAFLDNAYLLFWTVYFAKDLDPSQQFKVLLSMNEVTYKYDDWLHVIGIHDAFELTDILMRPFSELTCPSISQEYADSMCLFDVELLSIPDGLYISRQLYTGNDFIFVIGESYIIVSRDELNLSSIPQLSSLQIQQGIAGRRHEFRTAADFSHSAGFGFDFDKQLHFASTGTAMVDALGLEGKNESGILKRFIAESELYTGIDSLEMLLIQSIFRIVPDSTSRFLYFYTLTEVCDVMLEGVGIGADITIGEIYAEWKRRLSEQCDTFPFYELDLEMLFSIEIEQRYQSMLHDIDLRLEELGQIIKRYRNTIHSDNESKVYDRLLYFINNSHEWKKHSYRAGANITKPSMLGDYMESGFMRACAEFFVYTVLIRKNLPKYFKSLIKSLF